MIILCVLFRKYSFVPKRPLVCLFVYYLQNRRFFKYICQSILLFCLFFFVCQSPTGHNFKPIFTKLHHMVEYVIRKKTIVFEVKRSKAQHRSKVNNLGEISKILKLHPIHLKFLFFFAPC